MNEEYTVGYNDGYQTGRNEAIDELEQENRLLRARNDRLQRESEMRRIALLEEMQQNSCKFPLCQTEEYQQDLAEQIKRELVGVQQEPVAYWIPKAEQFCIAGPSGKPFAKAWEPLYTSPQPAQGKPLTDGQILDIA